MSFEDVAQGKPDQEMELKIDTEAAIDYPLASFKFSNLHYLTIHFPCSFGDEKTRIYYIGLRGLTYFDLGFQYIFSGSFQHAFREKIAIATYEARAVPDDHKAITKAENIKHVF